MWQTLESCPPFLSSANRLLQLDESGQFRKACHLSGTAHAVVNQSSLRQWGKHNDWNQVEFRQLCLLHSSSAIHWFLDWITVVDLTRLLRPCRLQLHYWSMSCKMVVAILFSALTTWYFSYFWCRLMSVGLTLFYHVVCRRRHRLSVTWV